MTTATIAPDGPRFADTNHATGERWYVLPDGTRLKSATTALHAVAKEALVFWAAKVVAEEAMEQLPRLVKAARRRSCGDTGRDRCGVCRTCAVIDLKGQPTARRDEAADLGKRVHKIAEQYVLSGELPPHDDDAAPFVQQYLAWWRQFQPSYDAAEMTVVDRDHGWAGTLDGVVRLGWCPPRYAHLIGQPLVKDTKTGNGVYAEAAMQLAAYRNAPSILLPDGTETPMLQTAGGFVLHLRPDYFKVYFVEAGPADFDGFLCALSLSRWLDTRGKEAIERAMWTPGAEPKAAAAPGTAKPAPAKRARKATNKAPAPADRTVAERVLGQPTTTTPPDAIPF